MASRTRSQARHDSTDPDVFDPSATHYEDFWYPQDFLDAMEGPIKSGDAVALRRIVEEQTKNSLKTLKEVPERSSAKVRPINAPDKIKSFKALCAWMYDRAIDRIHIRLKISGTRAPHHAKWSLTTPYEDEESMTPRLEQLCRRLKIPSMSAPSEVMQGILDIATGATQDIRQRRR